jgi:hypothetical protein
LFLPTKKDPRRKRESLKSVALYEISLKRGTKRWKSESRKTGIRNPAAGLPDGLF